MAETVSEGRAAQTPPPKLLQHHFDISAPHSGSLCRIFHQLIIVQEEAVCDVGCTLNLFGSPSLSEEQPVKVVGGQGPRTNQTQAASFSLSSAGCHCSS